MLVRVLLIILATTGAAFSQSYGEWVIKTNRDEFTDGLNVYMATESKETVACHGSSSQASSLTLIMGCGDNRTAVGVASEQCNLTSGSGDSLDIKYRVDKLPAKTQKFYKKGGGLALQPGGQSIFFIKQLIGQDKVIMRVVAGDGGNETVTFSLNGLDEKVAKLRKACNW